MYTFYKNLPLSTLQKNLNEQESETDKLRQSCTVLSVNSAVILKPNSS